MTTKTQEPIQTRWGYVPCDYETYQKLRRLQFLYLQHRIVEAAYWRWANKDAHNRGCQDIPQRGCDAFEQKVKGFRFDLDWIKKSEEWKSKTIGDQIVLDYRNAKHPKEKAEDVVFCTTTLEEIETLLKKSEEWYCGLKK